MAALSLLSSLFSQLDLTEFLGRVEQEGFISPIDLLELSDEEIKTFAIEIGMKRGHIVRCAFVYKIVVFNYYISVYIRKQPIGCNIRQKNVCCLFLVSCDFVSVLRLKMRI